MRVEQPAEKKGVIRYSGGLMLGTDGGKEGVRGKCRGREAPSAHLPQGASRSLGLAAARRASGRMFGVMMLLMRAAARRSQRL